MFRKILFTLAATTMIASPFVTAQAQAQAQGQSHYAPQHRQDAKRNVVKQSRDVRDNRYIHRDNARHWTKGQRFDRRYATNYRVVDNYRDYRLSAPPRGYHWVRSGNDAVLIAITSGIIGTVIGSALNSR